MTRPILGEDGCMNVVGRWRWARRARAARTRAERVNEQIRAARQREGQMVDKGREQEPPDTGRTQV